MGFVLILMAVALIVTGIRGTYSQLFTMLGEDFTGKNNFGIWLFAFFVIGALGYIPAFKKLSDAFLLLVIIVIIISNDKNGQGFFTGLQQAFNGQNAGLSATSLTTTVLSSATLSSSPVAQGLSSEPNLTIGAY